MTTTAPTLGKMDYVPHEYFRYLIILCFSDATHFVDADPEEDNVDPFLDFHGHTITYSLPINTDASLFEDWITTHVQPILDLISVRVIPNGVDENTVSRYYEAVLDAKSKLDILFCFDNNNIPKLSKNEGRWDAAKWYDAASREVLSSYNITATSTKDDLNEAVDEIEENALAMNVRLTGTYEWLDSNHDDMIAESAAAQNNRTKETP